MRGDIVKLDFWRERGVSYRYYMKYLAIVSAVREKWGSTFNQIVLQKVLEKNDDDKEQLDFLIQK